MDEPLPPAEGSVVPPARSGVPGGCTVVHVVATRQRRGAEVFASDLVRALGPQIDQRVVVLRTGGLQTVAFDAPVVILGASTGAAGSLTAARRLRAVLRSVPDPVVCAHGGEALRAAVLAGAGRIMYRRIGPAPASITHGWRRRWHAFLMRRASVVVAVAGFLRDETIAVFGLAPGMVLTVPNAVDPVRAAGTSRLAGRVALGIPEGARVIVSVGSLSDEKDPLRSLRITRDLLAGDPSAVHLFVGEGPLENELRAAASLLPAGAVRILPARPDIGVVLVAADVLLFSSRSEGMPAVLIEAGLAGIPVVADHIAGVGEVVIDGQTGILLRAGDDQAATIAVRRLLDEPEERLRLGAAARERCERMFTIDSVVQAYVSAFAGML